MEFNPAPEVEAAAFNSVITTFEFDPQRNGADISQSMKTTLGEAGWGFSLWEQTAITREVRLRFPLQEVDEETPISTQRLRTQIGSRMLTKLA